MVPAVIPPSVRAGKPTKLDTTIVELPALRSGIIPDKLFGGERPPKGAQLVIAAAGEPPPIPFEDITDRDKLAAWVRSVRATGHGHRPAQHYLLSALYSMILAQHSICPETRACYELLYEGLTEEQREVA